jgi:LPS-assembly protein
LEPWLGNVSASSENDPIQVTSAEGNTQLTGRAVFTGDVMITQTGRIVRSDSAYLSRDKKTGEVSTAELRGHVQLREPGQLVLGDRARLQLHTQEGDFRNVLYRLSLNKLPPVPVEQSGVIVKRCGDAKVMRIDDLTAHGHAEELRQVAKGLFELQEATYTTCAPTNEVWRMQAEHISLNHATGRGSAYNTTLRVKGVPVLYSPYISFPIDKRRQSGFLAPNYSHSTLGGSAIHVPYYWNIAPNYDLTLTPGVYVWRGFEINGLFRYLFPASHGQLAAGFLPNDSAFENFRNTAATEFPNNVALPRLLSASNRRDFISWKNDTRFNDHWSANVDYTHVSDDYYPQDFGSNSSIQIPNQLLQQGQINYTDEHWTMRGLLQEYETLHPVNQPIVSNGYRSLPQITLNGFYPSSANGLNYQLNSEVVYFTRSLNPGEVITPPSATRLNVQPGLSFSWTGMAGYATPNLQWQATEYTIANQPFSSYATQITRVMPIFSLDSGIYFDRRVGTGSYQQTLEPRVFYLYVPYRDQTMIPVFDSGLQPFSYDQLFRTNRFTGTDRIGDANQLSLALTTRLLDGDTGEEKLRASVGEIIYFQDRRVMLCGIAGCQDTSPLSIPPVGTISSTTPRSPVAGLLSYHINPAWSVGADVTWDPYTHYTNSANLLLQYQPLPNHLVNVGYHFVQYGDILNSNNPVSADNNLNQPSFSLAWPLSSRWKTVGSWTYNLSHAHAQTYFYGLEYNNCCWAFRFVQARNFTGLDGVGNPVFNNSVYLQLQLKGLGNIAANHPTALLTNAIPGYRDDFGDN